MQDSASFSVVTLNCAGAKASSFLPPERESRSRAIAQYLLDASEHTSVCVVALQEELGLGATEGDVAATLRDDFGHSVPGYFATALSPNRYPLAVKWGHRLEGLPPEHVSEGMGALVLGEGAQLLAPAFDRPDGATGGIRGRVIDLPILEFQDIPGEGWTRGRPPADDVHETTDVYYRPSYYQGNRDTEPRIATAHLIRLDDPGNNREPAQFVLINLHLATLKQESTPAEEPATGAKQRTPTLEARFLRAYQLSVISHFAQRVYKELALPLVIAGDFNATPDSPEMREFMAGLGLTGLLDPHRCYRCGTPYVPETIAPPSSGTIEECPGKNCHNDACGGPMYSHRGNCQLVDTILVTSEETAEQHDLGWSIMPKDSRSVSIDADADFSDHFPVWAHLQISPRRQPDDR